MDKEILYFIRAILLGIAVGISSHCFFLYFKLIVERAIDAKFSIDLWYWFGFAVSTVLGILTALLLISYGV
ncbi:MAG: hypothetical protein PHD31_02215 [Candidatus Pacebacteria bacterium]|nr:hypothetical protein [Candidatus Paceibacterota bacterium]